MADVFPPGKRSQIMRRVRSKNSGIELEIRRIVWHRGYRYRLHRNDLPGAPDLVFPGKRKIIFVHGCFWHGHDCARGSRVPKVNREYWIAKIEKNRARDRTNQEALRKAGWEVLVVWECEIKNKTNTSEKIFRFLATTHK